MQGRTLSRLPTKLAVFVAVTACGSTFRTPERAKVARHTEAGSHFWVLADSQLNNVAGDREQSEFHDAFENVAIRPVSLDLWSSLVLRHVMHKIAQDNSNVGEVAPSFFLGDGANTSCESEYTRFLASVDSEPMKAPWFAALGNHDGFYMGNLAGPDVEPEWELACSRAQGGVAPDQDPFAVWRAFFGSHLRPNTMPKAWAVLIYLHSLWTRHLVDDDPLDVAHWHEVTSKYGRSQIVFSSRGRYQNDGAQLPVQVTAAIANTRTWRDVYMAYVVQDITLPGQDHVLIVDTSDFLRPPPSAYEVPGARGKLFGVNNLPGELGMVSHEQRDVLEAYASAIPQGRRFWLAGHHNWQSISVPGAFHLRNPLFSKPGFVSYISAHTHDPTATGGVNGATQWEVNVASITDWPMEYVRVDYWPSRGDQKGDSTDIHVGLRPSYEQDDEQKCTISRAHFGSDAGDIMDRAQELEDADGHYVQRGLSLYKRVLEQVSSTPEKYPEIFERVTPEQLKAERDAIDALDVRRQQLASHVHLRYEALSRKYNEDAKAKLHALQVLDEHVLQLSAVLVENERSCAIWASHAEQEYWAGTIVGEIVRAAKRPMAAKKVIDGGMRIDDSTWRVTHEALPSCPDSEQRHGWFTRTFFGGC